MTLPPESEEPPPEKELNPWLILGMIVLPAVLTVPFALAPNLIPNEKLFFACAYALPVISGIVCTIILLKDGLRIQRDEDPDLTTAFIIIRSFVYGIVCVVASAVFLFGSCMCVIDLTFNL